MKQHQDNFSREELDVIEKSLSMASHEFRDAEAQAIEQGLIQAAERAAGQRRAIVYLVLPKVRRIKRERQNIDLLQASVASAPDHVG